MMKPLKLPRGVCNLFSIGNSVTFNVPEKWNHRPDFILDSVGGKSMKGELVNNYISVTSPITLNKGDSYTVVDSVYKNYFFNDTNKG